MLEKTAAASCPPANSQVARMGVGGRVARYPQGTVGGGRVVAGDDDIE